MYLGYAKAEVLASGRDLLYERLIEGGHPTLARMCGILPPLAQDRYFYLSSGEANGAILVRQDGALIDQTGGRFQAGKMLALATPFYLPPEAGAPDFRWSSDHAPVLSWTLNATSHEAFVHACDPSVFPTLCLSIAVGGVAKYHQYCAEGLPEADAWMEISRDAYVHARSVTEAYWKAQRPASRFKIPEALNHERAYQNAKLSFAGAHPKYGHAFYGIGIHDNFPPNYITMLEAAFVAGDVRYARRLVEHVMSSVVAPDGSFAYYGASAAEYGQWLWLLERVEQALGNVRPYADALGRMAGHVLSFVSSGSGLIETGAEADMRDRVGCYLCNNLWAVRGLEALDAMQARWGLPKRNAAEPLLRNIHRHIAREQVSSPFGPLVPFLLNYPALPESLSACTPLECEDMGCDPLENTYANYRYYPEMLSSALLSEEHAQSIQALRERAGGELLCMTRFRGWLDDWPAFHYARYLIETAQRDKYAALLYAHHLYHGDPEIGVYYEQATIDGRACAEDCVPATLLTTLMLHWAAAFEPVGLRCLRLGRGIPEHWFEGDFSVEHIMTRWGEVCWSYAVGDRAIKYDLPAIDVPVYFDAPTGTYALTEASGVLILE